MAEHRLASLDADLSNDEGETVTLVDIMPDLSALDSEKRTLLVMDIDRGLDGLPPLLREVLVSRFLVGESCAEIGRRHGRTEQTISGWVREGIRQMKHHLEDGQGAPAELSK